MVDRPLGFGGVEEWLSVGLRIWKKKVAALDQMIRAKKVLAICLTSDLSLSHLS